MMSNLQEFDGKAFADVMRGDLELPGEEGEEGQEGKEKKDEAETSALTERIKGVLEELVEDVRPSQRLTDSPACLVLGAHDPGAQMRRILEATGQSMPESKPVFEYNAEHPLLERLDQEADEDRFRDLVLILFDQASLADGSAPKDSAAYVNRLNQLLLSLLKD
jgi:molecular chaperone HtpG